MTVVRVESNYCLAIDGAGQLYRVPSRFLRDSDWQDDFTVYGSSEMFALAHELRRRTKTGGGSIAADVLKRSLVAEAYILPTPRRSYKVPTPRKSLHEHSVSWLILLNLKSQVPFQPISRGNLNAFDSGKP